MAEDDFDLLVIGGGPAGATVATLTARRGRRVALIERESFPRFHIGESLLPAGNPVLKRLGVWDDLLAGGFPRKYGADFLDASGTHAVHNIFARGLLPVDEHTFQVERSRFDALLLDKARAAGVVVLRDRVSALESLDDSACRLALASGRKLRGGKIADASGRDCVLARALRIPCDSLPYPPKIAVYGHFTGVRRQEGRRGGNITIVRLPGGWFWSIPLDEVKTSVGVVAPVSAYKAAKLAPEDWFAHCRDRSPFLREWMAHAERLGEVHVTADYTFQRSVFAGRHHFLVGDAAAFIDPIFSSGVCLAMGAAAEVADYLAEGERCHRPLPASITRAYTRTWKRRILTMRRLIEVFYDPAGSAVFLQPRNKCRLFDAVNSVVAGHTALPWAVAWRFRLFLAVVALNRRFRFLGTIEDLPRPLPADPIATVGCAFSPPACRAPERSGPPLSSP